jgi:hypothetical protein
MMATETKNTRDTTTKTTMPGDGATTRPSEPCSTVLAEAPALSRKGLTRLLILMCTIPVVTVLILQLTMPPVKPGYLKAECRLVNVPPPAYYETPLEERIGFPTAAIIIRNTGEESWTHLNIRINNGHYQIYEHGSPLEPGEERSYLLNRFVHRSGAVFDVGVNRPSSVEIYARLPDRSRGTFEEELK